MLKAPLFIAQFIPILAHIVNCNNVYLILGGSVF